MKGQNLKHSMILQVKVAIFVKFSLKKGILKKKKSFLKIFFTKMVKLCHKKTTAHNRSSTKSKILWAWCRVFPWQEGITPTLSYTNPEGPHSGTFSYTYFLIWKKVPVSVVCKKALGGGSCYGNTLPYILTMHKVLSPLFLRYRIRNQLRLFLDSSAWPRAWPWIHDDLQQRLKSPNMKSNFKFRNLTKV
jgi:hypothetical protein